MRHLFHGRYSLIIYLRGNLLYQEEDDKHGKEVVIMDADDSNTAGVLPNTGLACTGGKR